MSPLVLFSPAKLNLFLAVTGRRSDGFHDLLSVVAPLAWGDTLRVEAAEQFSLECDEPAVPRDGSNLILKAAVAFRAATGWRGGARFSLEKRIPIGAGLGGGSSNGAAALRALNTLAGEPLGALALAELAAQLGSDCPLFLHDAPVAMRGRGEQVDVLPEETAARICGRRVLVFKPSFGISTPWAYKRLAEDAAAGIDGVYMSATAAESRLEEWMRDRRAPLETLLYNSLERPAFAKFVALPALLSGLRGEFGLIGRMSGSGSACFAFLADDAPAEKITAAIREAWGPAALVLETRLGAAGTCRG